MWLRMMMTLLCLSVATGTVLGQVNVLPNPDGKYYTAVQDSGDSQLKYDLVFIGDGFTDKQQEIYNQKVNEAIAALKVMVPYSQYMQVFNIWRVNVISKDSGVDHPTLHVYKNTALNCSYGDSLNEPERLIASDSADLCFEAAGYAPDNDAVVVLVNDTQSGGGAFNFVYNDIPLVFSSIDSGFGQIITHELAHAIGLLADEYMCYLCDRTDDHRRYTDSEPGEEENITTIMHRNPSKWWDLITPEIERHLPTKIDEPPGVVGLWEGGNGYKFGIYRPQRTCYMSTLDSPFCKVCERTLIDKIKERLIPHEISYSGFFRQYLAAQDTFALIWNQPYIWHWPWLPCRTCPRSLIDDEIKYVLNNVPEGFMLKILDAHGTIISDTCGAFEKGLQVSFKENRAKLYFVELTSREHATGETLNITAQLFRNGKLETALALKR